MSACPRGGICDLKCHGFCAKNAQEGFAQAFPELVPVDTYVFELQNLREENAALRADVLALWQRLGDVLSLFGGKECMSAEQQDKLRNARALHALWKEES